MTPTKRVPSRNRLEVTFDLLEACGAFTTVISQLRAAARFDTPLLLVGHVDTVHVLVREVFGAEGFMEIVVPLIDETHTLLATLRRADTRAGTVMVTKAQLLPEPDRELIKVISDRRTLEPLGYPMKSKFVVQVDPDQGAGLGRGGRWVQLDVPTLASRPDVVPVLLRALLMRRYAEPPTLAPRLEAALTLRSWTGDLSELVQLAERIVFLRETGDLSDTADLLHLGMAGPAEQTEASAVVEIAASGLDAEYCTGTWAERVARFEARVLRDVLTRVNGNRSQAARELGISRSYLIQKAQRYRL